MLVINGANDYFVPQADTLVFKGRPKTEVRLLPDIGHCAVLGGVSKLPEVIDWLRSGFRSRPGLVLIKQTELTAPPIRSSGALFARATNHPLNT
jgi:hypothetical protein